MPRKSATGNVRKRCECSKWKTCEHPWYLDYQRGKVRYRDNLDLLTGRHAADFAEAQAEAHRAIGAKLDGRDPKNLQPGDRPTLAELLKSYGKRPNASAAEAFQVAPITKARVHGKAFGDWRADEITRDALNAFRSSRPTVAGNRNLAFLRACFNWAMADGVLKASPFRVGHVAVVKLTREEARTRRLQAGEEERLMLAAKGLAPLITAALESALRCGELLSLQWHQVGADLFLPAGKTKAKKPRRVPISKALRAVLEARRNDPAGEPLPPDAFVFGDEVGRRRRSIKTAWRLTCQRAKIVDLHFHDLRREAGSRWMDSGEVPLATIQRWLGHHNISQTSKYLAASLGGDESAMMAAFERKIGRVPPVTHSDVLSGSNGSDAISNDQPTNENAQQNLTGHQQVGTIH